MKKSELDRNEEETMSKIEILDEIRERAVKSFLDVIILIDLANRNAPMGGYDVMGSIHKEFNIMLSSGTVYSFLYALERDDLIKGAYSRRKRVYKLTEKGKIKVKTVLEAKQEILRSIAELFV